MGARTRLSCRFGWHFWRFVSMSDVRLMSIPGHASWLCRLTERCNGCGLTRTVNGADVPKRPKVSAERNQPKEAP